MIDAKTSRQINHEKATSMCNILFDKFGINKDGQKQYLKTIGAKYNVTPESIRQKINRTISYIQQEDELKDPLKKISMLRRYI